MEKMRLCTTHNRLDQLQTDLQHIKIVYLHIICIYTCTGVTLSDPNIYLTEQRAVYIVSSVTFFLQFWGEVLWRIVFEGEHVSGARVEGVLEQRVSAQSDQTHHCRQVLFLSSLMEDTVCACVDAHVTVCMCVCICVWGGLYVYTCMFYYVNKLTTVGGWCGGVSVMNFVVVECGLHVECM